MKSKINSIQYLRTLAVLFVIFSHIYLMRDAMGIVRGTTFRRLQDFCAVGGDLFFVISGFIITFTASKWGGKNAATDYAKRRFIRIAPAYYIASGIFLLRIAVTALFSSVPAAHRVIDWPTIVKTITILPIFDTTRFQDPILPIGWTLSFEFMFYLILTIIIATRAKQREWILLGSVIVLSAIGMIFRIHEVHLKFFTNPIILDCGFGVLICILYQRISYIPTKISIAVLILSLLWFAASIWHGFGEIGSIESVIGGYLSPWRVLHWGIPSGLFIGSIVFLERNMPTLVKANKFLLFVGEASFSLYLVHVYAFMFLVRVADKYPSFKEMNIIPFLIISLVSAFICGALFHIWVEKPLIRKLNKIFLKERKEPVIVS